MKRDSKQFFKLKKCKVLQILKTRTQITFGGWDKGRHMPRGKKKGSLFQKYIPEHKLMPERPECNSLAEGKSSPKYDDG